MLKTLRLLFLTVTLPALCAIATAAQEPSPEERAHKKNKRGRASIRVVRNVGSASQNRGLIGFSPGRTACSRRLCPPAIDIIPTPRREFLPRLSANSVPPALILPTFRKSAPGRISTKLENLWEIKRQDRIETH